MRRKTTHFKLAKYLSTHFTNEDRNWQLHEKMIDPLVKKNHLCGEKNENSAFQIMQLKDNVYINLRVLLIFK